jgi:putative ABC transport system permease protein
VIRFVVAQLRGRPRRALALLAGVLAATTGFTVLSGGATTAQLRTTGTVNANYRAAYDILVRPRGGRTTLEDDRGLVRPNYLSGLFGGITTRQLAQVRSVRQVEVAAPIAMLGYARLLLEQTVDLTDRLDPRDRRQLFRLSPKWIADRGLTVIDDAPKYVYVTRNPIYPERLIVGVQPPGTPYEDGSMLRQELGCLTLLEIRPDGRKEQLCTEDYGMSGNGTTAAERTAVQVFHSGPDGRFTEPSPFHPPSSARLVARVGWQVLVLAAAIDPAAEADLVGLDKAVVAGRYLTGSDAPAVKQPPEHAAGYDTRYLSVPTLLANRPYVDEQVEVGVHRFGAATAGSITGKLQVDWVRQLAEVPGTPSGPPARSTGTPGLGLHSQAELPWLYQPGSPDYRVDAAGGLHPQAVALPPDFWKVPILDGQEVPDRPPVYAFDRGFRPMTRTPPKLVRTVQFPYLDPVGEFDPSRLRGFSPLAAVPLETYQAPLATGVDDRSRRLLGGRPLQPNSNPAGYLATPPLLLTNLRSIDHIVTSWAQRRAPISAVRVRVAGLTGFDPVSRERVRVVAERIAAATGLDTDITIGSSPSPQTVVLPAGRYGRPELTLSEGWSRKGVAASIIRAADRKSLLLFGLILGVCVLFLGNAVAAAVRDRRRELAVLACLGWPARALAGAIFGEVALVGLAAGALAAAIAVPLADAASVTISGRRALLAIPVGLGLALLASAAPAVSAARAAPGAAMRPAVLPARRARRRRTVFGLAMANLGRVPGRTILGALALAVGVCALTMLAAVAVTFRNDVVGSLLGDAVAIRIRGVDVLAVLATVLLGLVAVADVLYINVRERSAELAALWAAGWSDRALIRLVSYEGLGIGALGAVTGAAAGLGGIGWLVGELTPGLVWLAAIAAVAGIAVAGAVAAVPALLLRRLPLSTLLAEE